MSGIFENTLCSVPFQGNYLATASATANTLDIAATAALIEREGLRFDGTAGAVIGNGGIPAVGTGDFTLSLLVNLGSASSGDIINGTSNAPTIVHGYFGANTGKFFFCPTGGAVGLILNTTAPLNTPLVVTYTRASGVGTFYLNGVPDGSAADTTNYSGNTNLLAQGIVGSRTVSRVFALNYALTQAEIAALTRRGLVTLPEQRGGSMTAIFSGDSSNFGGGVGNWVSNTLQGGSATVTTSAGKLSVTAMTGSEAGVRNDTNALTLEDGHSYTIGFTISNATGGSVRIGRRGTGNNMRAFKSLQILSGSGVVVTGTDYEFPNGTHRIRVVPAYNNAGVAGALYFGRGTNTTGSGAITAFELDDVTATLDGTLFEQDSGQRNAGLMVRDTSGNNLDLILPATGVSVIDPALRGMIRFTTTTLGNQQIGGTQVIIPTNARMASWIINSSGTPNVTLGDVSAGAQYRASAAVVSGNNQITLLTPFTPTGNLWVNSSTTATLRHTIMWEFIQ